MSTLPAMRWDGQPVSKPGLYAGVDMASYHGQLTVAPSISSSGLRTILNRSPAHYFVDSYLNPEREERADSDAFIFGRACHHLCLGEAEFSKHFVIRPESYPDSKTGQPKPFTMQSTWCKDWVENVTADGLTVLSPADIKAIRGMAKALDADPLVQAGILGGLVEHSLVWQDEETGIWLKARPDAIPTDSADFSDLKTTVSVDYRDLQRSIADFGYHVQGALVGMGCRAVLGMEMNSFSLVFVEKKAPFCVRTEQIKPCDLELGERQIRAALKVFARCLERGEWPGPAGIQADAEFIDLPEYARKQAEDRIALMNLEIAA